MGYRSTNTIIVTSGPVEVGPQAAGGGVAGLGLAGRGSVTKKVAQTGSTGVGISGRNATTRVVSQSGRTSLGLVTEAELGAAEVSGSFTHQTLIRDYALATGEAPIGVVYFTPSEWMVNAGVTVPSVPVAAAVSSEGRIQLTLAANDDIGTAPADVSYEVREEIIGQPTRIYNVVVHYDADSPIDLATLPVVP